MTPLEFFISVKNTEAKTGLEDVRQQINQFKQDAAELYEGPARESRIREEFRGIIKDISLGKDPIYVMISALERLSEVFRFAGVGAAALAIGFALESQLRQAATASDEFFDLFAKGMKVSVKDSSEDALKSLVKDLDELEKKYGERGWFERLIYGQYQDKAMTGARELMGEAKDRIDELETTRIEAHTAALRKMSDDELSLQAEIDEAKSDLQQKADQEREQGNENAAKAYEAQMSVAIDRITEKHKKAEEERVAKTKELLAELDKAQDEARDAGDGSKLNDLFIRRAQLMNEISRSQQESPLSDPGDQRTKDQTEVARLTKEINDATATQKKDTADKEKEAADKALEDAKQTEQLRRETLHAQYELLDKDTKVIAMRAEQARLENELKRVGVYSENGRLELQKSLADTTKELGEIQRRTPVAYDALAQIGGRYGGVNYSTNVYNEAASRAEKQRDQIVSYLKELSRHVRQPQQSAF